MKKIAVLCFAVATCFYACATDTDIHNAGLATRKAWVELAERLALPVLKPMAEGRLHEKLNYEKGTLEISPSWDGRSKEVAYMEAFARLMAGIAPWLALPDDGTEEGAKRAEIRALALKAYANAVDLESPDYLGWNAGGQTLVDAAYLVESFFRAWDALWVPLDDKTKERYVKEIAALRRYTPPYQNWLLFVAMEECFLMRARAPFDEYRMRLGLYKVEEWYVGDGRNFNSGGFLTLGFNGSQPDSSDRYTNNGSLYVTSLFLLPLGLPANDSFWTSPDGPWTSVKAWSGESFPKDHKWPINPQPLYWE